jgi:flavin reductase (DIM6/NTAB) family NADH-FMN oxidoreductase RutF
VTTLVAEETAETLAESVRSALAGRPRPVAIVSTFDGADPIGCTVSAFLCLSLRPPSLVVSLGNGSTTLDRILRHDRFGLSLLADRQHPLIERFATGPPAGRFRSTGFRVLGDVPLVGGCPGAFACAVTAHVPLHDHTLVVGDVLAAEVGPC